MSRPRNLKQAWPGLRHMAWRFWPYFRTQRGLIAGSTVLLLISTVLRLLEPWMLKLVFDRLTESSPPGWAAAVGLERLTTAGWITVGAVLLGVVTAVRALTSYLQTVGFAKASLRALSHIRDDVYRRLQRLSLSFHAKARSGDLVVRLINDVNMLKDVAVTAIMPLVADTLVFVGMWLAMAWLNWRLTAVAMVTLPLIWFRTTSLTGQLRQATRKQRKRQGAMASTAAESLTAIKSIQALSLERVFADTFVGRSRESQRADMKTARLSAKLARSVDGALAIASAGVLWYGARLVQEGTLTPGDLLVVITYLKRAYRPLEDFAKYAGRLARAAACGERVIDVLDREPEVRDRADARTAPALRGDLQLDNVTFAYHEGHPVLDGCTLRVGVGERLALVGSSGIGKSTVLNLVLRLYDPQQGRVLVDGLDLRELTLVSLRAQIAVVLQDGDLFAGTVRENIAIGTSDATADEIVAAAVLAGAHEFIETLPEGYETRVGERGMTLSRGQRQRIAIARVAIRKPPILILDEPTTGLDEQNERDVIDALSRLAEGRTTLLVTHDLRHVSTADRIAFLAGGKVVEQGTHDELLEQNGRYARLFRLQCATVEGEAGEAPRTVRASRRNLRSGARDPS